MSAGASALDLLQDIVSFGRPHEGLGIGVVARDVFSIVSINWATLAKQPRRSCFWVRSRKNRSTMLSQDHLEVNSHEKWIESRFLGGRIRAAIFLAARGVFASQILRASLRGLAF